MSIFFYYLHYGYCYYKVYLKENCFNCHMCVCMSVFLLFVSEAAAAEE